MASQTNVLLRVHDRLLGVDQLDLVSISDVVESHRATMSENDGESPRSSVAIGVSQQRERSVRICDSLVLEGGHGIARVPDPDFLLLSVTTNRVRNDGLDHQLGNG